MVIGWDDSFPYGMYSGHSVKDVWQRKPSYLVWTVVYTANRFDDKTMDLLRELVGKGPKGSLSYTLHREFSDRFMGGPW